MARNNIPEYDNTSTLNTEIDTLNIDEFCAMANINNMGRKIMAHLADYYDDQGAVNTVAGTADAITVTTKMVFASFATGHYFAFKAGSANTGAATIDVDGLGAKAIRRQGDSALEANDILADGIYILRYDAAYNTAAGAWVLMNPSVDAVTYSSATTTTEGIVELATVAEYRAGTDTSRAITPNVPWDAMAEVALSDGASVSVDLSTGIDFSLAIAGNRTLANPTNVKVGQRGRIRIVQDGAGSRTLTYGSNYEFINGAAPVLSTASGAEDILSYDCISSTRIVAWLARDIS